MSTIAGVPAVYTGSSYWKVNFSKSFEYKKEGWTICWVECVAISTDAVARIESLAECNVKMEKAYGPFMGTLIESLAECNVKAHQLFYADIPIAIESLAECNVKCSQI